jgi:D-glycero-D-manno-heptose 1,7-bisphosphate phosphatase
VGNAIADILNAMSDDQAEDFSNIEYVFLDRDGVLNRNPGGGRSVICWDEFELLPGVEDAIAQLNRSGRKVIVVTNQRAVALNLISRDELDRLHDQFRAKLDTRNAHLDAIYICPHDVGECNCRKPLTGLFEQAFRDFPDAKPGNCVMIGDSLRDIEAGVRMGMRTVFITGVANIETAGRDQASKLAQICVTSLPDFVQRCLGRGGQYFEHGNI